MVIDGYVVVCKVNGLCDSCYCIEYIELIDVCDVVWFGVLGIIVSLQLSYVLGVMDFLMEFMLLCIGVVCWLDVYLCCSLVEVGVFVVFLSDWLVVDVLVLCGIVVVLMCQFYVEVWDEWLMLMQVLWVYIVGGVWVVYCDYVIGCLCFGFVVDLVLLGGDIEVVVFVVILDLGVVLMICGGCVIYDVGMLGLIVQVVFYVWVYFICIILVCLVVKVVVQFFR